MRHIPLSCAVLLFAFLILTRTASAQQPTAPRSFETQTLIGFGGPLLLPMLPTQLTPTTLPFTTPVVQRFRSPRYSPVGLEVGVIIPSGIGFNLLLDVFRTDRFRLHVIDPGIFWGVIQPVSAGALRRNWDLTVGAGLDVRLTDRDWLTLDWRVFMPQPTMLAEKYGDFARPYVDEAWKGGQLWLGLAHVW